ncbi:hypothetical protein GGF42_004404 [Coemansia sp. RSA 2424]|nr:hypothetical protein GGF42_004404 [Coemansia sp. RSA 2424]
MSDSRPIHDSIQCKLDAFGDLMPVSLHALWGQSTDSFIQNRMVRDGAIEPPSYWHSPSTQSHVGFWIFNLSKPPTHTSFVEETALFTLMDDVTAELATRLILIASKLDRPQGFTVNLNIARTGPWPSARRFYFEASAVSISERKITVECPLFDADTGAQLMVARAIFVFMSSSGHSKLVQAPSSPSAASSLHVPLIDTPGACELSNADLYELSQVMSILPHGTIHHYKGFTSMSSSRLVVLLEFGPCLNGPPVFVHGGILGTVLDNASALLLGKVAGKASSATAAVTRDINYRRGVPMECKDCAIDACVESAGTNTVVIFAKLMRGEQVHTTLKTTFTLSGPASKL